MARCPKGGSPLEALGMYDPDQIKAALDFAADAHGDQKVPGSGFPYVVHLTKVALEMVLTCQVEKDLDANLAIQCAILHDCVEDAGVTRESLEERFGPQVAAGVMALTKNPDLPKKERMADSLKRLKKEPSEVRAVKMADRITNLEPPPAHWPGEKRRRYADEALEILEALRGASPHLEARLVQKHGDYQAHLDPETQAP
jgi:(p)ppGpp synthase/HD superfamily hydrolase